MTFTDQTDISGATCMKCGRPWSEHSFSMPSACGRAGFERNGANSDDLRAYCTQLRAELAALRSHVAEMKLEGDPPVCRLQLPDGSVPANARDGVEKWHAQAEKYRDELAAQREACKVLADEVRAKRNRINSDADVYHPDVPPAELRRRAGIRGDDVRAEQATNTNSIASEAISKDIPQELKDILRQANASAALKAASEGAKP